MVDTGHRPDATLPELLTAHARAVSNRRLALDLVGGGLVAVVATLWRPRGWLAIVTAGVCFTAFGVWAIAERRLAAAPVAHGPGIDVVHASVWRGVRAATAVVGTLAAVLMVFLLLFGVLGTWIS